MKNLSYEGVFQQERGAYGRYQGNRELSVLPQHDRPEPGGVAGVESPGRGRVDA